MADVSRLDGQVALVTGGAGILGRRFCQGLADAGAHVAVVDLFGDAADETAAELGEGAAGFACDVSDAASVKACVEAVMERFGRIDVLINNAAPRQPTCATSWRLSKTIPSTHGARSCRSTSTACS